MRLNTIFLTVFLIPLLTFAEDGAERFSQAIQLERGWNLVSWYIWPVGQAGEDIYMDDLFAGTDWFEWSNYSNPTDKVGRFDRSPFPPNDIFYPKYGSVGGIGDPWEWKLTETYPIYMESPAHFWEFINRPEYEPPTSGDLTPDPAWDDFEQVGLTTPHITHWYFISYPLRKQIAVGASETISWLTSIGSNPENPLMIVKDDAGNWYVSDDYWQPSSGPMRESTLKYLMPSKGYFLGFENGNTITGCDWFSDEGATPASVPPDPKVNQNTTSCGSHFQYKSRTHWWYPIQIDTIEVGDSSPQPGDEIAAYDGNICVGAQTFDGIYPIFLAAWMDDIATPDVTDGYYPDNDMTFIWYDLSENQEITFAQPPQIMANQPEVDPYIPTHSGFGQGFYAKRSLTGGIESINQLPQEYKLCQNFPNPFNSSTVIPLELPQRSNVILDFFDACGRKVWTVNAGTYDAGWKNVHIKPMHLASGVYFYRISAEGLERGGEFVDVGKMLLLK
ncbi:hypothetical protein CEE37_04845 [candidate division LCP-89 bacterium B3_LCP]|uniref:Secretion system C-terminal sorting domain-containing protein n=1 Tax=candidate division LCP-89 bacterium B3_LCP TaxID=2012998 RepID=A0A532V1A7_UNCL8|nr:MAG: hypothetical protein CEE37_04845 [candidate division LCP-89 bacterium B3_LCP]